MAVKSAQEKYRAEQEKKANKKKEVSKKFTCRKCGRTRATSNYYDTTNEYIDAYTKKMSICKDCIKEIFKFYYMQRNDLEYAIFSTCREVDLMFDEDIFGTFLKQIEEQKKNGTLTENIGALFGIYKSVVHRALGNTERLENIRFYDSPMFKATSDSKATMIKSKNIEDEMINFWGNGFNEAEYIAMQNKYEFLSENYGMETNLHIEALKTYIRYKVKEEFATAEGRIKDAKDWGKLASDSAKAAKLSPNQFSKADLQGGINTFSEWFAACEKENGVIHKLPMFKYDPIDAPDFIIYALTDSIRKLFDKPEITYEEIYKFYDEKKAKFMEDTGDPYGIFDNDPSENNRDRVEKFLERAKEVDNV